MSQDTATAAATKQPVSERSHIVRAEGVKKIYRMGTEEVHALRGVNLDVHTGEYLAIMGPSGSGKSTLFNMIGGLDTASEGRVQIKGHDVSKLTQKQLAWLRCNEIGYIFQTYNIIPVMTALENVTLPMVFAGVDNAEARERGMELLKQVGLGERPFHRPDQLSGGQQQRVAIARALANQPEIILADEPTANLDQNTGQEIIDIMVHMTKERNVTVISATHDHKMLKASDRVVWIRDGQVERIARQDELDIQEGKIDALH